MGKLEVTYPCEWNYTVIGLDEAVLRAAVAEVFDGKEHRVEFSKKSKEGKYISLVVKALTASEEERLAQFNVLGRHPAIKVVL